MTQQPIAFSIRLARPRNPLIVATRQRRAGRHGAGGGALRQQARRTLMRELQHLHPPHY